MTTFVQQAVSSLAYNISLHVQLELVMLLQVFGIYTHYKSVKNKRGNTDSEVNNTYTKSNCSNNCEGKFLSALISLAYRDVNRQ